jgi:hypothetical protein
MEYIELNYANADKARDLLYENNINYEDVDDDRILGAFDTVLEHSGIKEIDDELKRRDDLNFSALKPLFTKDTDTKKELIIYILDLGLYPTDDMIFSEIKRIFSITN